MAIHPEIFPDDLSYGTRGGPGFNTSVIETSGGETFRIARWAGMKHTFNVRYAIKSHSQIQTLIEFYIARHGIANGFYFKHWADYASTPTWTLHNPGDAVVTNVDETIGTGTGSLKTFQLKKTYTQGSQIETRTIRLPKSGTVKVALDGVDQASGWTVSTTTGIVTFDVAPSIGVVVTAGFEFYVPVVFGANIDRELQIQHEAFDVETMPDIPLVEINNDISTTDEVPMGYGQVVAPTVETLYDLSMGRMVVLNPQVSGVNFVLPAIGELELGGPQIWLSNAHATNDIDIYDVTGGTLMVTLTPGDWAACFVYDDSGTSKWRLFGKP